MSGPAAPKPQEYQQAAQTTGKANVINVDRQTAANRPEQRGPFGYTSWSTDDYGNPIQSTQLQGQLNDTSQSLQQQAYVNALRGVGTGDDARNQAISSAYGQATSRLDPQWKQQDEHLSSTLANQGLAPGSQAYRNAMLQQSQSKNDAYSSAMSNAVAQGTAAQNAVFNQNMQAQQLPYQQLAALRNLITPFGFNAAGSAQAPDALTAARYQGQDDMTKYSTDTAADAELKSSVINATGDVASSFVGGGGGGGGSRGGTPPIRPTSYY